MDPLKSIEYLVVHHSASPSRTTTPQQIRDWHLERGWDDVGYHWLIDWRGVIWQGRPLPWMGAHAYGANSESLGVCIIGNNVAPDPAEHWTTDQRFALLRFIAALRVLFPTLDVFGHRDVVEEGATECPGLDVREWLFGSSTGRLAPRDFAPSETI